jgi:hypothetical protein
MIGSGNNFKYIAGVAVDGAGNVFVADSGANTVSEIVAVNGVVSSSSTVDTIGSGFATPVGVAVDGSGEVFVTDVGNDTMKKIDLSDPPSLSFRTATNTGSTDTADGTLTVTVVNSGNAVLNFTVPANGNNPSISTDFTLDSTGSGTCPLTIGTPNTLAATISGSTVTLTGAGAVVLSASQAATTSYRRQRRRPALR